MNIQSLDSENSAPSPNSPEDPGTPKFESPEQSLSNSVNNNTPSVNIDASKNEQTKIEQKGEDKEQKIEGIRPRSSRIRNPSARATEFKEFKELDEDSEQEGKKRGRKRARVKDRQKHNEAETLRRRRMKSSFIELAKLCGLENAGNAHKASILKAAIAKVQDLEAIIRTKEREEAKVPKREYLETVSPPNPTPISAATTSSPTHTTSTSNHSPTIYQNENIIKSDITIKNMLDSVQKALINQTGSTSSLHSDPIQGLIEYAQNKSKEVLELSEYKKRAEGVISSVIQLLKQQVNYHSIFNSSSVAEDIVNLDGRIIDCNISFTRLLGYPRSRLGDPLLTIYNITHPDSFTHVCVFVQSLFRNTNRVSQTIVKIITADGRHIWARVISWVTQDETGTPRVIRGVLEPFVPTSIRSLQQNDIPLTTQFPAPPPPLALRDILRHVHHPADPTLLSRVKTPLYQVEP